MLIDCRGCCTIQSSSSILLDSTVYFIDVLQTGIEPSMVLFFDCHEEEMERRLLSRNEVWNDKFLLYLNLFCENLISRYEFPLWIWFREEWMTTLKQLGSGLGFSWTLVFLWLITMNQKGKFGRCWLFLFRLQYFLVPFYFKLWIMFYSS